MGARTTAERVVPPLSYAASDAIWNRAYSAADASTSGRNCCQATSSRFDDEDGAVVLLSDETTVSEAAPLISHNALKLAFCGGMSGAVAKTCTAPLARLTILYQVRALTIAGSTQQLGVAAALRHVAATEGLRSLWKGNLITIMHRVPYSAVNFFTYESTKRALGGRLPNEAARSWAAGATSGLVACSVAYPLDLLRTRVAAETGGSGQQQQYGRVPTALRRILAEHGVRGLYKGLGATLLQVVPGLAFNFCFYDTFKRLALAQQHRLDPQLHGYARLRPTDPHPQSPSQGQQQDLDQRLHLGQEDGVRRASSEEGGGDANGCTDLTGCVDASRHANEGDRAGGAGAAAMPGPSGLSTCGRSVALPPPSPLTSALCACASGLCTSTITFPLDVVRRRLQVYERGPLARLRYRDVVRAVYAEGGLRAFYRGIGPEYAKVLPGMAIAFTTYETLKRFTGAS